MESQQTVGQRAFFSEQPPVGSNERSLARIDRAWDGDGAGQSTSAKRWAQGLGLFSIGLGLAELLVPEDVARLIGAKSDARTRTTLRALGARELLSGVGILAQSTNPRWLWARLGGDLIDVAMLSTTLAAEPGSARGVAATAAVLGVAALDGLTAAELSREEAVREGPLPNALHVVAAVTVNRPPEEVYRFWHNFENLPSFMSHLESVRVEGDQSHWRAKLPPGLHLHWSAEIVEDKPNECISWRSLPGGLLQNHGRVAFRPAPGDRGTEGHVALHFEPLAGALGRAFGKALGSLPTQQLRGDLKRFKQVMETGSTTKAGEP